MNARPSDFTISPWNSVLRKAESEIIAANVMAILKRTGDTWRELTWDEYKAERLKDGNFTESEHEHFDKVMPYCACDATARLFCPDWGKVVPKHPLTKTRPRKILMDSV